MSNAVSATGILVKRNGVTVAEITEVAPGGEARNKIETSTHNDGESYALGVLRRVDPTFKVNFLGGEATHTAIDNDIQNNVKNFWSVIYPSGLQRNGDAYVSALLFDGAPVDGKQAATITLTWAGTSSDVTSTTGILVKRNGVTIAQVTELDPGGMFRNKIEVTTHNERREANRLGLLRQKDPSFQVNFIGSNATHQAVMDDIQNNVMNEWAIEFPSGISRTGDGWVQSLNYDTATVDAKQGAVITLAWAGTVVEALA